MHDAEVATTGDLHREMERVAELLEVLNHKVALQEARVDAVIAAIARTPGAAVPFKAAQPKPPPLVPFRYMSAAEQAAHPFYKTAPLRRPPSAADDIAEPAMHKAPPMQQPPSSTAEEVSWKWQRPPPPAAWQRPAPWATDDIAEPLLHKAPPTQQPLRLRRHSR